MEPQLSIRQARWLLRQSTLRDLDACRLVVQLYRNDSVEVVYILCNAKEDCRSDTIKGYHNH